MTPLQRVLRRRRRAIIALVLVVTVAQTAAALAGLVVSSYHLLLLRTLRRRLNNNLINRHNWAVARSNARRRARARRQREQRIYSSTVPLVYERIGRWDLERWDDAWCRTRTRFSRNELYTLLPFLRLDEVVFSNRYKPSPMKALCLFLCRLSWGLRLADMIELFGCSRAQISSIFNDVAVHLWRLFSRRLFFDEQRLTPQQLAQYAAAIDRAGSGDRIWGWIDGTLIRTVRPSVDQGLFYSGHKHHHGFKFQAVMTPDGIISSLFGPFVGSQGDWRIFTESALTEAVLGMYTRHEVPINERMFLYGDPAYIGSEITMGAYRVVRGRNRLTQEQYTFNTMMSSSRISIEHGFGEIQSNFTKIGFHLTLKPLSSPVACYFFSAVLFNNIRVSFHGSKTSKRFGVVPPSLEELLG